ncbi:MAG: zinc ribbon domain-containing protein [Candidatus Helarchaeota archaeon]
MNIRKWIGLAIMIVGTILGFLSQYLPWHKYHNIYSLGGYDYQVIVYLQTSLIAALLMPLTYLPLIGAFLGLFGCLLCLFPFGLRYGRLLGKISGIILLIGYISFPLFYYMIGLMFSIFGIQFVESFFPNMIGGWLSLISFIIVFIGSIVVPKSEIVEDVEKKGTQKVKAKSKKIKPEDVKMVKCISCGAMIKETDQFCPECGAFQ